MVSNLPGVGSRALASPRSCQIIFPFSNVLDWTNSSTDFTLNLELERSIFQAIFPTFDPSKNRNRTVRKNTYYLDCTINCCCIVFLYCFVVLFCHIVLLHCFVVIFCNFFMPIIKIIKQVCRYATSRLAYPHLNRRA